MLCRLFFTVFFVDFHTYERHIIKLETADFAHRVEVFLHVGKLSKVYKYYMWVIHTNKDSVNNFRLWRIAISLRTIKSCTCCMGACHNSYLKCSIHAHSSAMQQEQQQNYEMLKSIFHEDWQAWAAAEFHKTVHSWYNSGAMKYWTVHLDRLSIGTEQIVMQMNRSTEPHICVEGYLGM